LDIEGLVGLVTWGLLGPESIAIERRTRTLNLGACVRTFNDLAVPGLGGVWFGKQLFLATLGVAIAEQVRNSGHRATNIEVANAIEALGCWLALDHNKWNSDPRVRGATKMRLRTDLAFAQVRKPSFYVTQPMRQATIQPLRAFGFVESSGERFSGFSCNVTGEDFIDAVCGEFRPSNRSVMEHLVRWAKGEPVSLKTPELRRALSPIEAMTTLGREFLRERAVAGGNHESQRRKDVFQWIDHRRTNPKLQIAWDTKPKMLEEDHWRNLHTGSLFFITRDAAINVLDQNYDPSPNSDATVFCRQCNDSEDSRMIENLLLREGRVLQQKGNDVVPGSAFRGSPIAEPETARSDEEGGEETQIPNNIQWPPGISRRVRNLFLFNLDLRGELDRWLAPTVSEGTQS